MNLYLGDISVVLGADLEQIWSRFAEELEKR